MNNEILKGKWLQSRRDVRSWWGKMTDDDVDQIQGDLERFLGKLKERYGYSHEQAKKAGASNQNGKKDLFNEIRREILIHSQMEMEIFYPALAGTASARATELISEAEREHHAVEKLLAEMNLMNAGDK